MKTLTIKDLDRAEQLDRTAMAAVRGGHNIYVAPSYTFGNYTYAPTSDSSINAMQALSQQQSVLTATANDSAFLAGVTVNNNTNQNGKNKIVG
jgi:hypothetical protein